MKLSIFFSKGLNTDTNIKNIKFIAMNEIAWGSGSSANKMNMKATHHFLVISIGRNIIPQKLEVLRPS